MRSVGRSRLRHDRQCHRLESLHKLGVGSDDLNARRSASLGARRRNGQAAHPGHPKTTPRFIAPPGRTGFAYGLGLENTNGWIGHDGDMPGYESLAIYLPSRKATVVVLINTGTDITARVAPKEKLDEAITRIITPNHVY